MAVAGIRIKGTVLPFVSQIPLLLLSFIVYKVSWHMECGAVIVEYLLCMFILPGESFDFLFGTFLSHSPAAFRCSMFTTTFFRAGGGRYVWISDSVSVV